MAERQIHAVTGAFGYSGKYIAHRLLNQGHKVRTLTNSIHRKNPFAGSVEIHPFNFDKPGQLTDSLAGVSVLYNTYWVRFNHKMFTQNTAVENTLTMFRSAKEAGVKRIVHVSITNPTEESHLEYFRGKAILEKALQDSGISYSILRPTVLFGKEDILINNIAWMLRKFPVFGVFGDGGYKLQPIYVDDLAQLAVEQGQRRENTIIDAIGPETFTYKALIEEIAKAIEKPRPIISIPPSLAYIAGKILGLILNDYIITKEEIEGLMANLLYTNSPPAGNTKLTTWMKQNSKTLGKHYANEIKRRKDRIKEYNTN